MKEIKQYISEKLIVNNTIQGYKYHPKDKDELIDCIEKKINKEGLGTKDKPLNLNDIDTSKIKDMSDLFNGLDGPLKELSETGYFDISDWDVFNVEDMNYMFYSSNFNGDISDWDVSKVKDMSFMFAKSKFSVKNGDISNWNVKSLKYKTYIFLNSPLEKNPPKWYKKY